MNLHKLTQSSKSILWKSSALSQNVNQIQHQQVQTHKLLTVKITYVTRPFFSGVRNGYNWHIYDNYLTRCSAVPSNISIKGISINASIIFFSLGGNYGQVSVFRREMFSSYWKDSLFNLCIYSVTRNMFSRIIFNLFWMKMLVRHGISLWIEFLQNGFLFSLTLWDKYWCLCQWIQYI